MHTTKNAFCARVWKVTFYGCLITGIQDCWRLGLCWYGKYQITFLKSRGFLFVSLLEILVSDLDVVCHRIDKDRNGFSLSSQSSSSREQIWLCTMGHSMQFHLWTVDVLCHYTTRQDGYITTIPLLRISGNPMVSFSISRFLLHFLLESLQQPTLSSTTTTTTSPWKLSW